MESPNKTMVIYSLAILKGVSPVAASKQTGNRPEKMRAMPLNEKTAKNIEINREKFFFSARRIARGMPML